VEILTLGKSRALQVVLEYRISQILSGVLKSILFYLERIHQKE
jgi:hypothetical protein